VLKPVCDSLEFLERLMALSDQLVYMTKSFGGGLGDHGRRLCYRGVNSRLKRYDH
jgi:hypothetical protein